MLFHSICSKANAHLYTASIVDKIAAVIVISICFWHDATLAFSVIKCQAVKWLNASGWGLWWEEHYSSMSCSGGSVYAINTINYANNEEDVLSYETCKIF